MKPIRGYTVAHRAYYKTVVDRPTINLGLYYDYENPKEKPDKDDFYGEVTLTYDKAVKGWNLESWDDSWKVLSSFSDVIEKLSYLCNNSPSLIDDNSIINILDSCGFKDLTEYTKEGLV